MHRVLICDPLAEEGLQVLRRAGSIELDERAGLTGDGLRAALAMCDGVIVRSGTRLPAESLRGQSRLKAVVRAGVGVDNIDVDAATREGIVVMNTPGGNTLSTAEHAIALMLAVCRHVPASDASLRRGKWDRKSFIGRQLAGKTLGILGLGRVGLAVARRAIGLEMKVVGYDPFLSAERAAELGIQKVSGPHELFGQIDILTVHVPLTNETRGLVGEKELAMLPPGAFVINCARGGIVDEAALLAALKSGHIAGAALDVFEEEPITDSPFFKLPNVVVTPHLGASTEEAQVNVAIEAAQLMTDFLLTGNVRFAVNMVSLDQAALADVLRHLDIARRLGMLQAQLARGAIKRAALHYRGEATKKNTKLITAAFAMGLLECALEEPINLVNAEVIARERGIRVTEQLSSEPSDFSTLIRTEVQTERESMIAAATTRGAHYCRLVQIGPYRLDAFLDGTMVVFTHDDRPGLIGFIGTAMGNHAVNIAQMTVGRAQPGGRAIGILTVDSEPPKAALDEVATHASIHSVQVVKLPPMGELPNCFGVRSES
jgi:D-3-phosphoglycerate dehydrogenase